jgi:hypothetical protein
MSCTNKIKTSRINPDTIYFIFLSSLEFMKL